MIVTARRWLTLVGGVMTVILAAGCSGSRSGGNTTSNSGRTYQIRAATDDPKTTVSGYTVTQFKKEVEAKTGGKIKVNITYNGAVGNTETEFADVKSGALQLYMMATNETTKVYEPLQVLSLPFLFSSLQEGSSALNGELGKTLSDGFDKETGVRILGWYSLGFYQIIGKDGLVASKDDLYKKWRVTSSPIAATTIKEMGGTPVTLQPSDLYTALQTGTIAGGPEPMSSIVSFKLYEAAKYLTITNLADPTITLAFNDKFLKSLPTKLRSDVEAAAKTASADALAFEVGAEKKYTKMFKNNGVTIANLPASLRKEWIKVSREKIYSGLEKKYGNLINMASA